MLEKDYGDIIHRSRPVPDRDTMELMQRAKIFAPFAALTGFEEFVREQEMIYEERRMLSEDQMEELDRKLRSLKEGDRIWVRYFQYSPGNIDLGEYRETFGEVGFPKDKRMLYVGREKIYIADLVEIEEEMG